MDELEVNARVRSVWRLTAACATAALLAGCSSDVSRLASGPFGPADHTPTASIGSRALTPPEAVGGAPAMAAAPSGSWGAAPAGSWGAASAPSQVAIQSAPLAPPTASAALSSRPAAHGVPGVAAGAARSAAVSTATGSFGPWTAAGGTPVTVRQGESASVLAARYGVPMEALVKANGLTSASQVTPGRALVIPIYNAASRTASNAAPAPSAPPARNVARAATNVSAARSAPVAARAQTARVAQTVRKPEQKTATQRAAEASKTAKKEVVAKANESVKAREAAPKKEVALKPAAAPVRQQVAAAPAAAVAPAVVDKPEFRWPARGRIIQGFKNGANDGISIAVPEGTAVKAAESGVVAYAGSELKGYGNLVLIRHPNGFVSAYAHNGELNVKRGENVKRGQTIAKSGQSGNVAAPQLHFELRKGSTPVDPTQYLAGL